MPALLAAVPLLLTLGGDPAAWERLCASRGWLHAGYPAHGPAPWSDAGVRVLAELAARQGADPSRVYLLASPEAASGVFYAVSRLPDAWAAAVVIDGSQRQAVETNRLFEANSRAVPLLWVRPPRPMEPAAALDWLAGHRRDPFPAEVDCETGNPAFARCFWIHMTGFNAALRNDVLDSTRVKPGSGATLGFEPGGTGPGVVVESLAPGYRGPLRAGDRVVALAGKPLADPAAYAALLDQTFEARSVAVVVERGRERLRLETRIELPKREETVTARAQGRFLPDLNEIQILSRAVASIRLIVPEQWAGAKISWNGAEPVQKTPAGCWDLQQGKDPAVRKCP